ncbi:iron uptake system protein EfeO [Aeromicrobium fastidiosum]|uniref:Peptidase M75 family protein n=1 Tax=Aeromicrobium fastidiosum TaxID=52699 RepID=A0A641AIX4_9ACTN|nr:iron uptake system protein EfeO [Aeromicrobium fastidiosum]KAA1374648.1 peptidase M75 family protein [Aeromicrobium fastidiosum]MBP2390807.1 iron uptake system component EfeO [Aeromicrobium fastidiosum]
MTKLLASIGIAALATVSLAACASDPSDTKTSGGALTVKATDSQCTVSGTKLKAGPSTFKVTNAGSKVTEFYVYADGDRIMGEVENVGPGLTRNLIVDLPKGTYEGACKPGMIGDGIRQTLTVTGEAAAPLSDSEELTAAATSYERYVKSQSDTLIVKTTEFVDAVKAGNVDEAKKLFPIARTYWERIEPVAEKFGDLDPITDGREPDAKAEGVDFTGWHRIEKQLWVENNTEGMDPYADQLLSNVKKIVALGQDAPLTALELAQGSKGLLDEVATGKITGEEDEFSHTDLWDFKANIEGSQAAISALRPVLVEQDPALVKDLDAKFAAVDTELNQYQDKTTGDWTFYDKLTDQQIKQLSDAVAALSEPISKVAAVVAQSA